MTERIPDSKYQQLQHFISESEWDGKAVMKEVARKTNRSLESLKGEKGLILDESGNEKAGENRLEWLVNISEMWGKCAIHKMGYMRD